METGIEHFKAAFDLKEADASRYSPLVLAYVGDAVYELMIRTKVVNGGNTQVNKLHRRSAELVKAATQAAMIRAVEEELTPEEHAVYKRGRNAKSSTMAKHATMKDYRTATGFEALTGWLYLSEQYDRLFELVSRAMIKIGALDKENPDEI